MVSEKVVEYVLHQLLLSFDRDIIFYNPSEHPTLKLLFRNASKTGSGMGMPDRILFDEQKKILVVIECKPTLITNALSDLKHYSNNIDHSCITGFKIWYVAVVNDTYEIYDSTFNRVDGVIVPKTFKLSNTYNYNLNSMEKDMRRIHNYIRDYTKISNEDKSFFIACILVALKKESFKQLVSSHTTTKKYVYDYIKDALHDFDIDISVFAFLRNDENNKHFIDIINMVNEIHEKNPTTDLLNRFYSEFVRYSNTDSKSLGIVLTPDHITRLMIELLDIQPDDTFLDLCTGTGSFVMEALKYAPLSVTAIEYQTKLFNLLKCNMVLRDVNMNTHRIIKGDCFQPLNINVSKSAINPPYGMSDKKELDFVIHQLKSIVVGGRACAIIPKSKLNNNSQNNLLKTQLLDLCRICCIINCNPSLFAPNAMIECCILVMERTDHRVPSVKKIIDYTNDGIETIIRNGKVCNDNHEHLYQQVVEQFKYTISTSSVSEHQLIVEDDWCYNGSYIQPTINMRDMLLEQLEYEYTLKRRAIQESQVTIMIPNPMSSTIGDLFILKRGNVKPKSVIAGIYSLVSASSKNKGVHKYIDSWRYENCITVANNGSIGSSFYHPYKFNCTSDVTVLIPSEKLISLLEEGNTHSPSEEFMKYICIQLSQFKQIYTYNRKWNLERMRMDTIYIPMDTSFTRINMDWIKSFVNTKTGMMNTSL